MPNKFLGQHWLRDRPILELIVADANLSRDDTVLEIGPGLGTLTSVLLKYAGSVVAVEFDVEVARKLPGQFPGKNLLVVPGDILTYDLGNLPVGYKVVANIPYYITKKIIQSLVRAGNSPENMVLLMQQEVAEKYAASQGELTLPAIELQLSYDVHVSTRVPKMYFIPQPKVDSQVLVCTKKQMRDIAELDKQRILHIAQIGFSSPRKKLRSSLSGGLSIDKSKLEQILHNAVIDPGLRAEDLSISDWVRLADILAV
ncbi:ribosomal RNA small subunit methyltransferase A [Candidatus Saccharibacteria bacterium]|nr:ribosomal RNA small subunit methyltransferase A [Candidatus Saccharibacteria bacterium]NCU40443.1 ribosomal RNA small subunit methyltransferase A [Candidatus Saccharibacteria bacterium]